MGGTRPSLGPKRQGAAISADATLYGILRAYGLPTHHLYYYYASRRGCQPMYPQPISLCASQAFHNLVREAKRSQSLHVSNDKAPIPGRRRTRSVEPPSSQCEVNGKLPSADGSGDDGPAAKAVLADGKTSVPCRSVDSVLSTAGPAPAWPDQRRAPPPSPSSESDMTVEAATQLVLEGAMKWPYAA